MNSKRNRPIDATGDPATEPRHSTWQSRTGRLVAGVLCCVLAFLPFSRHVYAGDIELLDTWDDGNTGPWARVFSQATLSNPSNYLKMAFMSQYMPMSENDLVRKFISTNMVITNVSFRFRADNVLPDDVRVFFHSTFSGYWWSIRISPTVVGDWVTYSLPLNKSTAWVIGVDGGIEKFNADVSWVDWVGVYVRRSRDLGGQNYGIDDFRISGIDIPDANGDGIPDNWEARYGISTNDPNAALADSDGDGMNNMAEYRAGTDPTDPTSKLMMNLDAKNAEDVSEGLELKWDSVAGRSYRIERATDLVAGFSVLCSNILATPPVNIYEDVDAKNSGPYFYRIKVE